MFCGSIPHKDVFNWLDEIDIYVQPSKVEGLPRAVIEAMSRGCCCIGTDVGGIPELIPEQFLCNSKKLPSEISKMLKEINKNELIHSAERNIKEAKKYEKNELDRVRYEFYCKGLETEKCRENR